MLLLRDISSWFRDREILSSNNFPAAVAAKPGIGPDETPTLTRAALPGFAPVALSRPRQPALVLNRCAFELGDRGVERVDVCGRAESGLLPGLLAEEPGQSLFELPDAGVEAGGALVRGEQVCLERGVERG